MNTASLIATATGSVSTISRWYGPGTPLSKRSQNASHQASAISAASAEAARAMPVHRNHDATGAAACTTETTRSCVSASMPAQSGTEKLLERELLGDGERAVTVAEVRERSAGAKVSCSTPRSDRCFLQGRANAVALGGAADEQAVDVAGLVLRAGRPGGAQAELGIARRSLPATVRPSRRARRGR